jgi:hypothetical protein
MRSVHAAVKDFNLLPAAMSSELCLSARSNFMKRYIFLIVDGFKGILLAFVSMRLSPVAHETPGMGKVLHLRSTNGF